jgi:hypothetical protein
MTEFLSAPYGSHVARKEQPVERSLVGGHHQVPWTRRDEFPRSLVNHALAVPHDCGQQGI